jgi:hypothetical protein
LKSGRRGKPGQKNRTARQLGIEQLEDRTLPAPLLSLVTSANSALPPSDSAGGVFSLMNSQDGRFTVYRSTAPNLVAAQVDSAATSNVFLYDRQTETTTLVSHISGSLTIGANGDSDDPRVSSDGRFVSYSSTATNLVTGQNGPQGQSNVFLYDRSTGNTTLVSHRFDSPTTSGNESAITYSTTGFGFGPNTGRFLLFDSAATDLIAGQNGPLETNVFLYDTTTGANTLVSHDYASSLTGANGYAISADLTPDGSSIVFESLATDVVSGGTGALDNVFLYNRATGNNRLISGVFNGSTNSPTNGAGSSSQTYISADGRIISYLSDAPNLVAQQTASSASVSSNVFYYDTTLGKTFLVSGRNGSPSVTAAGNSKRTALSSDGSTIAFISDATNLNPVQGNSVANVFLYHTSSGALTLASHVANSAVAAGGVDVNGGTIFSEVSLSATGRFVSYYSYAGNLVAGQPGPYDTYNSFVYDAQSGQNTLVSHVNGSSTAAGNHGSNKSRISLDGSTIAFLSAATNLDPSFNIAATGGLSLFLFDVATESGPVLASRSAFQASAISVVRGASSDGRYVVFTSNGPNVIPNQVEYDFYQDVFLLDRTTGTTTLVSHIPGQPTATGNLGSFDPVISKDGNFVAFTSEATNLVSGQSGGEGGVQVFLFSRLTGTVTLVSHDSASPTTIANSYSSQPVISANGRFIAFESPATDLIQGLIEPIPGTFIDNVYLYDATAGTTTLVSHAANVPTQAVSNTTINPVISDDGGFVAYQSASPSLVLGDIVATYNIYLFDRSTGDNTLVSHVASSATTSPSVESANPVISSDGNFVAFVSFAADLVSEQNGVTDTTNVFLFNRQTGDIILVSGADGSPSATANNYSDSPAINDDGAFVSFRSSGTNLIPGQTGTATSSIFLFSRQSATVPVTLVSHAINSTTTTADGDARVPVIDGDGSLVAYLSTAANLVSGQSAGGINNVFGWARTPNANFLASGSDGSPTVISPAPAFLPILTGDPVILFSAASRLVDGASGTTNGYANTLIDITFTGDALLDGHPPGPIGTLSTVSELVGQLVLPSFRLPAGAAPDNPKFAAGTTQSTGTASLLTQFVVNIAVQSSFSILVQADTGLGLVQRAFTLSATSLTALDQRFVSRVYLDLLQRPVDAVGLAYWSGLLDNGAPRSIVAAQLTHSNEYFATIIKPAYVKFLGRAADATGLAYWTNQMRAGLTDEQLEANFIASPEYYAHNGGTDKGWIDGTYVDLLGRQADTSGESFWIVQAGIIGRVGVALGFAKSSESEMRHVEADYMTYLHRPSDPGGLTFWTNQFIFGGQTNEDLITGFLASDEYFQRSTT